MKYMKLPLAGARKRREPTGEAIGSEDAFDGEPIGSEDEPIKRTSSEEEGIGSEGFEGFEGSEANQ